MRIIVPALAIMLGVVPDVVAQRAGLPAPTRRPSPSWSPRPIAVDVVRGTSDVDRRIHRERDSGRLSHRDARRARAENDVNDTLTARYAGDGRLSDDGRAELANRNAAMRSLLDAPAPRPPRR